MKRMTAPTMVALGIAAVCVCLGTAVGIRWMSFQWKNAPIVTENARLEEELAKAVEAAETQAGELEELNMRTGELRRQTDAIRVELADYQPLLAEGESSQEYIETQMVELLERRQELVQMVRDDMSASLGRFFSSFGAGEYVAPEPIDIPRELLKDTVSAITGQISSPAGGVVGDAVTAAIDSGGEDLWDNVSAATVESIGSAITGAAQDAVTDAIGISDVVSGVSTAQDVIGKIKDIFDTTPNYALAVTLNRALTYAQKVTAVLDDPAADLAALEQAVYDYNIFRGYCDAAFDLRDETGLHTFWDPMLYMELAQAREIDRALGVYALLLGEEGAK